MKNGTVLKALSIILLVIVILLSGIIAVMNNYIVIEFNPRTTEVPETTTTPTATMTPTTTEIPLATEEPTTTETPAPTEAPVTTEKLKINQINVGCADAYLLQSDNTTIMIDGGKKESRSRVLQYLENIGVETLDFYIATHWHCDHVDNMNAILKKFGNANTIVYGPSKKVSSTYTIPSGKGKYVQLVDGNTFSFDGVTIKCMGPYKVSNSGNNNYDSLNFLVQFGESKAFFTGDYVHKKVLEYYKEELTNIDIYKMAHHGLKVSNYSGSPDVLPTLNPKFVLVPANSSGGTQSLLTKFGISSKVYDNKSGDVVIVMDKSGEIVVSTFN